MTRMTIIGLGALVLTGSGFVLATEHARGQPAAAAETLELEPLVREALEKNPEILAAVDRARALSERILQAGTLEDPEFKVQLWNTPESLDVTRTETTIYGLAQRFPFPGTLFQQEEIAARAADQSGQRLAAKQLEIEAAVKIAYYELFYAHKALDIHHEHIDLLQRFFEIANAKFRVGKGTQVDVLKAQVELSKLFQLLPLLEQRRETAQARINTLLDRDPQFPLGVPREPAAQDLSLSVDDLENQALRFRPEVREAELEIARSESAEKLARLQYYPKLQVEVQRWQNFNAADGFGGNVMVNIPFAFWTKPKYDAQVREARAEIGTARARKHAIENLTRFGVTDVVEQFRATRRIVTLYATTVIPQAVETRDAALAGYRTGRTDFLDLIDADRAVLTYRLEYFRSLADLEQQRAALERIVGIEL